MSTTEVHIAPPGAVISALNHCIEICIDGAKGYAMAAADVRDPILKSIFEQRSQDRADFVLALQSAVRTLRAAPEKDGTSKGVMHRGWLDLRLAAEGRSDRLILEECARGERAAVKGYQTALQRTPLPTLPSDIRNMLQAQYISIQAAADETARHLAAATH